MGRSTQIRMNISSSKSEKSFFELSQSKSSKFVFEYPNLSLITVGISIIVAKINTHTQYPIPEYFDSGIGYIPDTHTRCPFSRDTHTRTRTRRDFPSGAKPCSQLQQHGLLQIQMHPPTTSQDSHCNYCIQLGNKK